MCHPSAVFAGAHDHVEATAEGEPLPPPKRTPAAIIAHPASYADDASKAIDEARSMVPWWGWLAGAAGAALGIIRFLPGPGGAVADLVWKILAPNSHQQADSERESHATAFQSLVGLIENLPNTATIGELKVQVTNKAPSTVRDAIGLHLARRDHLKTV